MELGAVVIILPVVDVITVDEEVTTLVLGDVPRVEPNVEIGGVALK